MAEGKPPVEVELAWEGNLRFRGRAGPAAVVVDSDGRAGPSPVQALALALAGCMSVDVVHILERGRQPLRGLRARLRGERAPEDPHRLVRVDLRFGVTGEVAPDKVERAIALSREKYCSVWHSLRQDIEFTTSFEVRAPSS
ncbi:MAG TPA: OsmC family protein [Vicinamibacteria bacterium]|nr:OsmC family protein [Vicinamibacteria bacterium]